MVSVSGNTTVSTEISIHALRKESDKTGVRRPARITISIHALRKESDLA